MAHTKDLPPFGHYLLKQITNGTQYAAIIFMGNHAESRAVSFQDHLPYTCYLPTGTHPKRYQWPVAGCRVYLIDTSNSSGEFVKTCVLCLLEYGATRVDYFSSKSHQVFTKGVKK